MNLKDIIQVRNEKVSTSAAIDGTKISPDFGSQAITTTGTIKSEGAGSFRMPVDHWSGIDGHKIADLGQIDTHGSYEINITSNGYRKASPSLTWASYVANGQTGAAQIGLRPDGKISFRTDASKITGSSSAVTTRMVVENNGDVGIGTTTPSATLHVDGTVRLDVATSTSANGGSATALPAQPVGYLVVNINGTNREIPYYAT